MTDHLPRNIPLTNASNLRDLGGWPTQDGRRVAFGKIYRAPALVGLAPEDEAAIAALGLRTICDFRGVRERAASPVGVAVARNLPLPIEPSVGAGLKDILRTGEVAGHLNAHDLVALLAEAYVAYALQSHAQYRALFATILEDDALPLLLHCSAGKDRTGFGAALILTALGVSWTHVVQDYLATNQLWRRETAAAFSFLPDDLRDALLAARESLLVGAFDAIAREYGSLDTYLGDALGVDAATRTKLREALLF